MQKYITVLTSPNQAFIDKSATAHKKMERLQKQIYAVRVSRCNARFKPVMLTQKLNTAVGG